MKFEVDTEAKTFTILQSSITIKELEEIITKYLGEERNDYKMEVVLKYNHNPFENWRPEQGPTFTTTDDKTTAN